MPEKDFWCRRCPRAREAARALGATALPSLQAQCRHMQALGRLRYVSQSIHYSYTTAALIELPVFKSSGVHGMEAFVYARECLGGTRWDDGMAGRQPCRRLGIHGSGPTEHLR